MSDPSKLYAGMVIVRERCPDCATLRFVDVAEDADLDAVMRSVGLRGMPEVEITRQEALELLRGVVDRDLAYESPRQIAGTAAATIPEDFLALFGEQTARYFTNGTLGLHHARGQAGRSWTSLTDATFDTGVVAIDQGRVGVLWFEDED